MTRLFYPFLTGLMISRMLAGRISSENASGSPIHLKGGFWWASLLLIVLFSIPCIGGYAGLANGIYQAIIILLVFPLILLIGAGSRTTDTTSTRICNFLGDISYPLYIVSAFGWTWGWLENRAAAPAVGRDRSLSFYTGQRPAVSENDIPDIIGRFRNLDAEESRSRKDQSFIVPVDEIRANDYDLSINKYKEVEKVKVEYEGPSVVLGRIEALQSEINAAFAEFREKYL